MEQRLWMILQLFGGAALFLYSMDTLTDALQQAAGDTLRQALARLTAHPLAGVLTGAAVTAVVQSSSAVTVLVLGLVGAGLLTLQRAVPVVFGANIGTTVTAQLLAFRLEDARYLLLVAGLLLWLIPAQARADVTRLLILNDEQTSETSAAATDVLRRFALYSSWTCTFASSEDVPDTDGYTAVIICTDPNRALNASVALAIQERKLPVFVIGAGGLAELTKRRYMKVR